MFSKVASWYAPLRKQLRGEVLWNRSLAEFTTIKAGGTAQCLVHPEGKEDLKETYALAQKENLPVTILGKGSNVLVADRGIPGIVIRLVSPYFTKIQQLPNHQLLVRAGVLKSDLLEYALDHSLGGLEFSMGIPGDLGGALKMNAGTKYGSYADILVQAEVFRPQTLSFEEVTTASQQSAYRTQTYIQDGLVTECLFQLQRGDTPAMRTEVKRIMAERAAKQPLEWPNFGSAFKNPDHPVSAGRMIERTGLKGLQIGGAQVSTKHANFILNREEATATDILKILHQVQRRVLDEYKVKLQPEVRLLGDHPEEYSPT